VRRVDKRKMVVRRKAAHACKLFAAKKRIFLSNPQIAEKLSTVLATFFEGAGIYWRT
jgi:hypothetical protein